MCVTTLLSVSVEQPYGFMLYQELMLHHQVWVMA